MKERMLSAAKDGWNYLKAFAKWLALSVAVGLVGGAVGVLFLYGIEYAGKFRNAAPWLLFLLPVGGLFIVWAYRVCKQSEDIGTNDVLLAVRAGKPLPAVLAPLILVSTVVTHLLGGSAGREGAALQLGGSIGRAVARVFRLTEKDMRVAVLIGMSAVFAALFGTPLTAAFFAMEVVSVGVMYFAALVPCLAAALIGFGLMRLAGFSPVAFRLLGAEALSLPVVGKTALLAAAAALLSILFCVAMHGAAHGLKRFIKNPYLRVLAGGVAIVLLTLLAGTRDYNGVGSPVIAAALAGNARPEAFALKLLFTAVTLGAGFKGGEIVPSFFVGATFGCVAAPLFGLDPAFGAAVGLIALFCGITNCPVASLFLAIEMFGGACLPHFGVTVAIAYTLSGNYGVYGKQLLVYSKLHAELIDEEAR